MEGEIFLLRENKELVEMKEQAYDSEELLQKLVEQYPRLLAGDQIDTSAPRKWLLISREMGLPSGEDSKDRWAVDHLFLDQDGIPTLVEVKRSSDNRIRREVVGQMLDYAANAVVYWPLETIRSKFEVTCEADSIEPDQRLRDFLGSETNQEEFWQKVKTNLLAGKVRLLFVADEIPSELRRVVEFMNSQMDPAEVLAVEIKQYIGQNLKTLVPRVLGQTSESEKKKGMIREYRQWDESSFFEELGKRSDDEAKAARRILEWANERMSRIWWGRGKQTGSFIPVFDYQDENFCLIAVWTNGYVAIQFGYMVSRPVFSDEGKRKELWTKLNKIQGVAIPENAIAKYPSIQLSILKEDTASRQFLDTLDWAIEDIKSAEF